MNPNAHATFLLLMQRETVLVFEGAAAIDAITFRVDTTPLLDFDVDTQPLVYMNVDTAPLINMDVDA